MYVVIYGLGLRIENRDIFIYFYFFRGGGGGGGGVTAILNLDKFKYAVV